jgi:2,3-bisphosphoglycerate-independent phosphoglycerate mutase
MDRLAKAGRLGRVRTVPEGMHPGSDIANLSILGYNPREYYSGRAPLEAASIGIELYEDDVAFRCNLVTLKYNRQRTAAIMEDYSSGHITTEEAKELINEIDRTFGTEKIRFYPGISYRHLMVWSGGSADIECVPPHDILGKGLRIIFLSGQRDVLRQIMQESVDLLDRHPST